LERTDGGLTLGTIGKIATGLRFSPCDRFLESSLKRLRSNGASMRSPTIRRSIATCADESQQLEASDV
jgi:hypothetical protein